MVKGLDKFKDYFEDYTNQYILIGGTACDIIMEEYGIPFRATKDLDVVLFLEVLDISFGKIFWRFIEAGGYETRLKSSGEKQFYRFTDPINSEFPKMIELFSRSPLSFELEYDNGLVPIHISDDIKSLSAILLNDDYYDLLKKGRKEISGCSILSSEILILFKIKAWLDLKLKKEKGEPVDSHDIKKHKNDVFRLLNVIDPTLKISLNDKIKNDVNQFLNLVVNDRPDLKNLKLEHSRFDEYLELIRNIYF
jgi:hypothetical protein